MDKNRIRGTDMKKKAGLSIVATLLTVAFLTGLGFAIAYGVITNSPTVDFDESVTYQTFNGFGTSSAWNFRVLGEDFPEDVQNQVISLLYGDEGLDLDIFRYNLGDGSIELENCTYDEDRKTESFFDASKYEDDSSFSNPDNYDFSKDDAYVSMLLKAFEIGDISKLVIFANSPHYLLTKSGMTHGARALENNLSESEYEAFADYYLICSYYIKELLDKNGYNGVRIYLSPVNEPQWDWGGVASIQHGCHFGYVELAKFYDVFYKKITAFNAEYGTNFVMDIFECGCYDLNNDNALVKEYLNEFAKYDYFDEIKELSVHSYGADDSIKIRNRFQKYLKNNGIDKKINMSEYCVMQWGVDESVDMGLYSSKVLMRDLIYNNATEWSWWLGLAYGDYEDGLVYLDKETNEINLTYRYYTYKNVMSYVDVGDVRVKAKLNDSFDWSKLDVVAFKKPDGRLVIVVLNSSNKDKTVSFSNLKGYSQVKTITTSEKGKLVEAEESFSKKLNSPAKSIKTFVLS